MQISTVIFMFATLEQYYTGELILGKINGIDDGSIVYVALCCYTGYYGTDLWKYKRFEFFGIQDITIANIIAAVLTIFAIFSATDNLRNIYLKRNGEHFKKVFAWHTFIAHFGWFFISAILFYSAAAISPAKIMETHPNRVLYAFSFIFIMVIHRMQFTHVTLEIFNPFRRSILISWGLLLSVIISVTFTG